MKSTDTLMDELAGSLRPVRTVPLSVARGALAIVGAATVGAALSISERPGVLSSTSSSIALLSLGLFFLVGAACGTAVTRMALPAVGAANNGWRWAVAAMLLLPASALCKALFFPAVSAGNSLDEGAACLLHGLLAGAATAILLTLWLRRGAPVRIELASWLVGLSAGAIGAAAIALTCPHASLSHIGLWHSAIVVVSGILGRLALPPALRW